MHNNNKTYVYSSYTCMKKWKHEVKSYSSPINLPQCGHRRGLWVEIDQDFCPRCEGFEKVHVLHYNYSREIHAYQKRGISSVKMPQEYSGSFENCNRPILTFSPPVPALGQVGETIYRCITYIGCGEYLPPYQYCAKCICKTNRTPNKKNHANSSLFIYGGNPYKLTTHSPRIELRERGCI